jgi:4-aminobutyrate aminotransferase-like enzyme
MLLLILFTVGHCHPHVVRAGQDQLSKVIACNGFLNEKSVEYAQRIIETLPDIIQNFSTQTKKLSS